MLNLACVLTNLRDQFFKNFLGRQPQPWWGLLSLPQSVTFWHPHFQICLATPVRYANRGSILKVELKKVFRTDHDLFGALFMTVFWVYHFLSMSERISFFWVAFFLNLTQFVSCSFLISKIWQSVPAFYLSGLQPRILPPVT